MIVVISAKEVALESDDPELPMKTKINTTFIGEWVASARGEESGPEVSLRPT